MSTASHAPPFSPAVLLLLPLVGCRFSCSVLRTHVCSVRTPILTSVDRSVGSRRILLQLGKGLQGESRKRKKVGSSDGSTEVAVSEKLVGELKTKRTKGVDFCVTFQVSQPTAPWSAVPLFPCLPAGRRARGEKEAVDVEVVEKWLLAIFLGESLKRLKGCC